VQNQYPVVTGFMPGISPGHFGRGLVTWVGRLELQIP